MILISHRGNIDGKQPELENSPKYILNALSQGYNVEIDVWYDNGFWLGHDAPKYKIEPLFLTSNSKLWCHAKNVEAIAEMGYLHLHYFWHETDTITITSRGYIWAYPGKQPIQNSIAVMPELHNESVEHCLGVCSDFIKSFKS